MPGGLEHPAPWRLRQQLGAALVPRPSFAPSCRNVVKPLPCSKGEEEWSLGLCLACAVPV